MGENETDLDLLIKHRTLPSSLAILGVAFHPSLVLLEYGVPFVVAAEITRPSREYT